METKKIKIDFLWELIGDWQDARDTGEDLTAPKFSFLDIEKDLYDKIKEIETDKQ